MAFDPYHIWLGIPPEDQPPSHYRLLAIPEIAATVHLDHIKTHYYASHRDLNPFGIVPVGPDLPWAGLVASA